MVDRRSVGGYCFLLGSVTISWRAKKQSVTSRSSAEDEYKALAHSSCEVLWLQIILADLTVPIRTTPSFCDSKTAIDLTTNPVYEHIELDVHFIREKIAASRSINVTQVTSKENLTDQLTKGLGKVSHCSTKLGLFLFFLLVRPQFVGGRNGC